MGASSRAPAYQLNIGRGAVDTTLCVLLVCAAFGLVYFKSLAFVYVEGDDAEIVAYHASGRQADIQPPYSPYESLFDALLSLVPPREDVVRKTAMGITAACAPVLFLLLLMLAFDWTRDFVKSPRWPIVAIMLLAAPEFYYLGMVLTPSIVAMTLMVGAHLLLRRSNEWSDHKKWSGFIASTVLFGLGAAFRWDTILYGGTIAADMFCDASNHRRDPDVFRRVRIVMLWGLLAGAVWLIVLNSNGYGPIAILRIIRHAGPVEPLSWSYAVTRIQPLLTPALGIVCLIGFVVLLKQRSHIAIVLMVSFLLLGRLTLYGVPKWMITGVPALMAVAVVGISVLWQTRRRRYALIALAVVPWLIGVRVTYRGTAWGPGFEIQGYDGLPEATTWPRVTIGAGTAVPTPEGPRPLFGHAWILGGGWRKFVNAYWLEQQTAFSTAIRLGLPVLIQDSSQGLGVDVYRALGFESRDSISRTLDDKFIVERRWTRRDGMTSRMLYLTQQSSLFDPDALARLQHISGHSVVIVAFPSTMANLYQLSPQALDPLGKITAVFHIDRFVVQRSTPSAPSGEVPLGKP
jgi:hypothetical protein